MNDKVVIVTGASGDIGRPLVQALLNQDYIVAACVRDKSSINFEKNDNLQVFECDFSDDAAIKFCVDGLKKSYKDIYGLIHCVGISHGASFLMTKPEDMHNIFLVNYFSIVSFTQQLVRKMIKKRTGCIVNIASTAGVLSDKGTLAYGASKAALIHSSKVMATELGSFGIRVNAVAPAVVESKMAQAMDEKSINDLNMKAALTSKIQPGEVVDMILYLLSNSAVNITGQVLKIDKGICI